MRDHGTPFNQAIAEQGLVLLTEVGSTVHGTNLPGTNDVDLQGICIESPGVVLGHREFEQYSMRTRVDGTRVPKDARSEPGGTDKVVFSLRKWTAQAVKGNPTALLPLFVPDTALVAINKYGDEIRDKREMFLSKQAGYAFRGYLRRQYLNAFQDAKHTNRPELVAEFGFDTKSAYHALRLAIQGRELMENHQITLPIDPTWREFLLEVRKGQIKLDSVMSMLEVVTLGLETAAENTTLPDRCDMDEVDVWLTKMYQTFWKEKSWV